MTAKVSLHFRLLLALVLSACFGWTCYGSWYVGNTDTGEWIQYTNVWLGSGSYRFTANAGSPAGGGALHLEIDGVTIKPGVAVPNTGRADLFSCVHLGSAVLPEGNHTLRVVFETPGVSLDWFMLRKDSDGATGVKATDVMMVRPPTTGMLIAPIVSLNHHTDHDSIFTAADVSSLFGQPERDANANRYSDYQLRNWYRAPMYRDFDRRTDRYWDIMVEQLLATRAQVPLIHCRETADFTHDLQDRDYAVGAGWHEGPWLKKFVEAVRRNPQAASALQIGMYWDNGGIADGYYKRYASYPAWGDAAFADYVMQYWLGPWFDNVLAALLYQPLPSRPVISLWSNRPSHITSDGKMGVFLANLRERMLSRYGFNPLFLLPTGGDVDAAALAYAWGNMSWYLWGGSLFNVNEFGGTRWGFSSCGSRKRLDTVWLNDWDPVTNTGTPGGDSAGSDAFQSPLDAEGNSTLLGFYSQASSMGVRLIQEEGFYNIAEGSPVFRSCAPGWNYPNQHMAAMRRYADPNTESLFFEAEACDAYYKTNVHENLGGSYRCQWFSPTGLDVYRPLHNLQPWIQKSTGPGNLVQVSAGFFDVWALDAGGKVWAQHISGMPDTWTAVGMDGIPKFTCLSVGKHFAWAINGTAVYCCKLPYGWTFNAHTAWTLQSGSLVQLSVGDAEVWGIDAVGGIYRRPVNATVVTNNNWTAVPGPALSRIAAGSAFVWGISGTNLCYTPTASVSWRSLANPNNLTQLALGSEEVWGVNAAGKVYRRSASGIGEWELVDGNFSQISIGENYAYGLSGSTPSSRKLEGYLGAALATAPAAPAALTATPGNTQVRLSWTGSQGATCYNVKRATASSGPYTTIATGVYLTNSYADTGLTNGQTCYYEVSAANGGGETFTAPVNVTPTATGTAPVAPASLTATAGPSQVSLSWTASSGATGYNVKRASVSGGPYALIAGRLASTSYTNTAISSADYYYVVSAVNSAGESFTDSAEACARPYDALLSRSGWVATASVGGSPMNALDGSLSTRWATGGAQAPGQWFRVDMGAPKTFSKLVLDQGTSSGDYPRGFQVQVSNDGSNWGTPIATGTGSSAATTSTFPAQTARYVRITQTGSTTGTYWSIHEFYAYLGLAEAPAGLRATAGNGQVTLNWSTIAGAASYNIKRSSVSGGPYTTVARPTGTSYTDTELPNGATCYYVISANAAGESANSLEVSATPSAPPVLVLTSNRLPGGGIQLSWTNGVAALYHTPGLTAPVVWAPVTNPPVFSNGQWTLTLPAGTNRNGFYRLQQ